MVQDASAQSAANSTATRLLQVETLVILPVLCIANQGLDFSAIVLLNWIE